MLGEYQVNGVTKDMLFSMLSIMYCLSVKLFQSEVKEFNLLLFFLFSPSNRQVSDSEDAQDTIIFRLFKFTKTKDLANQFEIFYVQPYWWVTWDTAPDILKS